MWEVENPLEIVEIKRGSSNKIPRLLALVPDFMGFTTLWLTPDIDMFECEWLQAKVVQIYQETILAGRCVKIRLKFEDGTISKKSIFLWREKDRILASNFPIRDQNCRYFMLKELTSSTEVWVELDCHLSVIALYTLSLTTSLS